jgi:hypothetical protein
VDLKKLTPGEMTIAISGILLVIFSFIFDWFGIDVQIAGTTVASYDENAWGNFWTLIAVLLGIVMVAYIVVTRLANVEVPERLGSIGWGVFLLAGGVIALLFILIALVVGVEENGVDLDPKVGIYLGLLCTIGLAVGGFLCAKERGHLAELQNRRGGTAPGGTGGGPTPPAA